MTKRRKLTPKVAPKDTDPASADVETPRGTTGGFWGGSAVNLLQRKLDAASTTLSERILQGLLVVELEPDQIEDERGSDRQDDWKSDDSLEALIRDIKRRGQSQPIRVRPQDPDWAPSSDDPLDFADVSFIVQSGRRRLESCRRLGIPVRAIIRTDQGDALQLDLEERFLENTVRRDLSAFEELLSVGLIAQARQDEEQKAVAADLHVSASDVSLGLACLELFDDLVEAYDVNTLAKRDFRQVIPALRRKRKDVGSEEPVPAKERQPAKRKNIERELGSLKAVASRSSKGLAIRIAGWSGTDDELSERLERFLETLANDAGKS